MTSFSSKMKDLNVIKLMGLMTIERTGNGKTLTCWDKFVSPWTGLIHARGPHTAHSGPPPPLPHVHSVHDCVYWSYTAGQSGTERQIGEKQQNEREQRCCHYIDCFHKSSETVKVGERGHPDILTLLWQLSFRARRLMKLLSMETVWTHFKSNS